MMAVPPSRIVRLIPFAVVEDIDEFVCRETRVYACVIEAGAPLASPAALDVPGVVLHKECIMIEATEAACA
jgi:hypothetical protein